MAIYGDGVPYVANKYGKKGSLICLYFSFPHRMPLGSSTDPDDAGAGDSTWIEDMHLFTVLRKEDLHPETFDAIWAVLAWDMSSMLTGTFPTRRHDGAQFNATDGPEKNI